MFRLKVLFVKAPSRRGLHESSILRRSENSLDWTTLYVCVNWELNNPLSDEVTLQKTAQCNWRTSKNDSYCSQRTKIRTTQALLVCCAWGHLWSYYCPCWQDTNIEPEMFHEQWRRGPLDENPHWPCRRFPGISGLANLWNYFLETWFHRLCPTPSLPKTIYREYTGLGLYTEGWFLIAYSAND